MDTLFKLKIASYIRSNNGLMPLYEREITNQDQTFFKSKIEAINNLEHPSFIVKENQPLSIRLQSDNPFCSFYSDLLEVIPNEYFEPHEQEQSHFLASNRERYIYDINGDYPLLIPGKFIIEVTHSQDKYYTILEIQPKNIDDDQLEAMRREVENVSFSLAKDFHFNMLNTSIESQKYDPQKITFLLENYSRLMSNLMKIEKFPDYEINKVYLIKKGNRKLRKNHRTIRFEQKNPHKATGHYSFENVLNYNTIYNQNLKYFLTYISKFIGEQINYITSLEKERIEVKKTEMKYGNKNLKTTKSLEELLKIKAKLMILLQSIKKIYKTEWFEEVKDIRSLKSISRYTVKKYYALFYEVFVYLREENAGEKINYLSNFGFYWRETSRLYEVWGLLEIFKLLKNSELGLLNIKCVNGNKEEIDEFGNIFILEFENHLKLEIFFDQTIPGPNEGDKVNTIEDHKKPDLRIDVYRNDIYLQTMIGDFKYSNLQVNNINKYNATYKSLFKQFKDYSNIRVTHKTDNIAINKLFCMLPKEGVNQQLNDIKIKFISLRPLKDNQAFSDFLVDGILSILAQH